MKFTKDDARKELSAQMTAKGEKLNLSERSLNEQLDTLIPLLANEETELADFVTTVLPIFKTADANVRNDVSAGIVDYKKQNPFPKKEEKVVAEEPKNESDLATRLAALEAQVAKAEQESRVASAKRDIVAKLKEKGVKDEELINSLLSEVSISDGVDVDAKAASLLGIYNKFLAHVDTDATPGRAGGANPNKGIEAAIKEASKIVSSQRLDANE